MVKLYIVGELGYSSANKITYKATSVFLILLCFATITVLVNAGPVKIKNGDWIKFASINTGKVPFTTNEEWSNVTFIDVTESTATAQVITRFINGTEIEGGCCMVAQGAKLRINVDGSSSSAGEFAGFVIPTNLTIGDVFQVSGHGIVIITGEITQAYAGANRTVVYAPYASNTISYWDKETGIFLEETTTTAEYTMSYKAVETNLWSASSEDTTPTNEAVDWQFYATIIIIPAIATVAVIVLILHRRKKPINLQPKTV